MEGNLCLEIDWASLIVGSKFTIFALFYFVFWGNFPSTSPHGAYVWRGDLTEGFLHYEFGGLIFGGAYFWNFMALVDVSRSIGHCEIIIINLTKSRNWFVLNAVNTI